MWVLVTGANGGIGQAIAERLGKSFSVVALDCAPNQRKYPNYIQFDLEALSLEESASDEFLETLSSCINIQELYAVVNNAAIQIVGGVDQLRLSDYRKTMSVNVDAPLVLSRILSPYIAGNRGAIVNIGSIHSRLSKSGFAAYAISKSALAGLSNALALELGEHVGVNTIEPAAILTDMLQSGFESNPGGMAQLSGYHPTRQLGTPEQVAKCVEWFLDPEMTFLNGARLELTGGIHGRLHDPG